eukprot:6800596-Prorocentrum_lima.AAC.1
MAAEAAALAAVVAAKVPCGGGPGAGLDIFAAGALPPPEDGSSCHSASLILVSVGGRLPSRT